jgi:hypothetical protein
MIHTHEKVNSRHRKRNPTKQEKRKYTNRNTFKKQRKDTTGLP